MSRSLAAPLPVLLLLLAASPRASADGAASRPPDKEARERFQRAELAFNVGKFSDALTEYQAAYEAKPLPGFLFNIAQCHRNLHNYEEAQFFYRRYLALAPDSADRATVEGLVAEMTRRLDDERRRPTSETAGETQPPTAPTLFLAAAPAGSSAAPPPADGARSRSVHALDGPTAEAAPARESRPVYRRWWFWAAVAVVATGAITTAVVMSRDGPNAGTLPPIDARGGP